MRALAIATFCVCAAGLVGPDIARWSADREAEQAAATAMARVPGVLAGRIRSRGGAAWLEIADAKLAGHGWSLAADRLVIPGADVPFRSLVTAALARPAGVTAENVVIVIGGTKIVIPHLEARGTDLTSRDLAALLDPANTMTLTQRLAKLTAAQVVAPTVLLGSPNLADPATGDHLTFKSVSLTDVGAGRVGALAIGSAAFSSPQGSTMAVLLETGHLGIDGLDLPLALDMATGSRTDATTALRALFRSVALNGIVVRPEAGTTIEIGAVLAGALRGRPLTLPPSDVATLLDKPDRSPADRQILADLVADAAGSAALDHIEVRDVVATKAGGQPGFFKLGRAALDGFELVKLGSFSIEALAFGEAGAEVSLGRFVLGDYDGSGFVEILKQQFAAAAADAPPALLPARASLAMTDLHIAFPAMPRGLAAIDPAKRIVVDVPVASIGAGVDAATGVIASRAAVELAYDVTAGAGDPSFSDLNQYGLARLDLTGDYGASYDPAAKQIALDRLAFNAQGLGQVAVAAVFGNAPPDLFRPGQDRDQILEASQSLVFQRFTVAFVNSGAVEKMLPPLAAAAKVSVPLFKAQLKAQAELSLTQVLGPGPTTQRLVTAIRTFIDTPKTFNLSVAAPNGLSVGAALSAADPKALLGQLDVRAVPGH